MNTPKNTIPGEDIPGTERNTQQPKGRDTMNEHLSTEKNNPIAQIRQLSADRAELRQYLERVRAVHLEKAAECGDQLRQLQMDERR